MKELRIEYSSFGIRREVTCPVPEKWEELTPEQFLLVSRLYLQEMDESSFLKKFYSLPSGAGSTIITGISWASLWSSSVTVVSGWTASYFPM